MAFGFRPATPGTIVVLAATVLLVLVSVSVPITKSIYFLKANITADVQGIDIKGTVTLGCWGYCVGDTCTPSKLGYNLDILKLFGENGNIAGVSNAVLKWITYLLILHPIAAALAALSTLMGLVAHLRGFGATCFTTCIASLAATVALLAFVFDIVVFLIAKNRIESAASGESAELGNAVWMTLAAMILLLTSGFFFGCGACIFRRQRHEKQVSDLYRPQVDADYGGKMRQDAYAANARLAAADQQNNLPAFAEYDHQDEYEKGVEQMPLNPRNANAQGQYLPPSPPSGGAAAIGGGYGGGYDDARYNNSAYGHFQPAQQPTSPTRRNQQQQLRFADPASEMGGYGHTAGDMVGAGVGAGPGARLAAEARAQRGHATREDLRLLDPAAAAAAAAAGAPSSSQGQGQGGPADYYGHDYAVEPFSGMHDGGGYTSGGGGDGGADEYQQYPTDTYAANPYYTPSQRQQYDDDDDGLGPQQLPTSPTTRLVGPRVPSAGPNAGPRSPTAAGHGSASYPPLPQQQQQRGEPPVLPYRRNDNGLDDYAYPQQQQQQQQQAYPPPPEATYDYEPHHFSSTDMYGAPMRY
ncbi:pali-domain-containing protein [Rhodotorula sp. JG-1b]|nr:pali-domain-containing protein [Rhodotorula sp. JG-1b]